MLVDLANNPRALFERKLPLIEYSIRRLCRRKQLGPDEADEFYSYVMARIVTENYRALQSFAGKGSWQAYIDAVLNRQLLDFRIQRWGRWRPSVAARRLGATAESLDRLINREGHALAVAVDILAAGDRSLSRDYLWSLGRSLPKRARHQMVGEGHLSRLRASERSDQRVLDQMQAMDAREIRRALATALRELDDADRRLLYLRFERNFAAKDLAPMLGIRPSQVYQRIYRCFRRLRRSLEGKGVSGAAVARIEELNEAGERVSLGSVASEKKWAERVGG